MNDEARGRWRRRSWFVALPVTAIVAFLLGGMLLSDCGSVDTEVTDAPMAGQDGMEASDDMAGMAGMAGMGPPPRRAEGTPPDEIVLTDRARALARIETTATRRMPSPAVDVRLLGRVDYDETGLKNVTAWTGGRIDRLHVQVTGETVRRGQTIATLYSPEVYSAHQDLLTATRQVRRLENASSISRSAAAAARNAAETRLALLGVPRAEIERMAAAARPARGIAIRTPFAGTVIERAATEGSYVQTGAVLYRVADLSTVWAQLEAYERDLGTLSLGQTVSITVEALPDEIFTGSITFMDPTVDSRRRIARVRVELDNADGQLLPGMFVNATVRGSVGEGSSRPLVIPESAPLFTGRRSIVYVERANAERPTYDARVVRLGPRMGGLFPVVAGLAEGERVVTEGAFYLDADLQIQGGASMMTRSDDSVPGAYDSAIQIPAAFRAELAAILGRYLDLQRALAADDIVAARTAADGFVEAATAFEPTTPPRASRAWRDIAYHFRRHGQEAADADSPEPIRDAFESISHWMGILLQTFGNPSADPLRVAECPMAFGNEGATWFQSDERVRNAFFGQVMEDCGEIRMTLEPGSYLMMPHDSGPEMEGAH